MLNLVKPTSGTSVVIVGAGGVGLAALMAVNLAASKPEIVVCVDINSERLEIAKKYGATHVINPKETPEVGKELQKITDGIGCDAAIDTTGRPAVLRDLLDHSAKRGMVVSVGVGDVSLLFSHPFSGFIIYSLWLTWLFSCH
jgi:aryl-alcohol dehydrogenase